METGYVMPTLKVIFFLLVLLIDSNFLSFNFVMAYEEDSIATIQRAEATMASAYEAVVDAERAGGNVSGLLVRLNEAGDFLAMAQMSYRAREFEEASSFADLSRNLGKEVEGEARELENSAWDMKFQQMRLSIWVSLFGVTAVVFGCLWFWGSFKRWYFKRVLKTKPEAVSDDS